MICMQLPKKKAEELVIKWCKEGQIDAVIINPTFMIGPYSPNTSSGGLVLSLLKGEIPGIPGGLMNFVDTRDVAKGLILANKLGKTGERYIMGGYNMTYKQFFELVGKVANYPCPKKEIPYFLALMVGWFSEAKTALGMNSGRNLDTRQVKWSFCKEYTFDSSKAISQLGYSISPSLEDGILATVNWFKKTGALNS